MIDRKSGLVLVCGVLSVVPALSRPTPTLTIQARKNYVATLRSMVKPLCDEASSLLFLNDGSFPAKQFLHDFLLTHTTAPVQLADMTTWLSDEQTPSDYYQNNHNTEFSLTMIVFYNASLVGMLLASLPYGWIHGPLQLLSLNIQENPRHLLVEANTGRHLSLVQTQVLKDARLRYTLTTYLPFKPGTDRFCVQTLNPLEAMTRQHLVQDRFPSFHGHVLHLASWTDNFPVMFFDDFTTSELHERAIIIIPLMIEDTDNSSVTQG
ncbi:uncharacterized protein LOC121867344 [Homarus americanus]|uniref:uncharacterized protein LOC121867344 n=1 Tax=Homarus americanus TaxID=6706 RepID=UPI001C4561D6|nr:uncharacterized protein LOC121867344 [Homarus americanus]